MVREQVKAEDRRTCSKTPAFIYFVLESTGIILLVYIITGGDIFSRLGLILSVMGLVYPIYKLPVFLKRVDQCKRFLKMEKKNKIRT